MRLRITAFLSYIHGARIKDAIESAGGLTENADLSKVNLAYSLSDGCKLRIPSVNENNENENNLKIIETGSGNNVISEEKNAQKININTATQSELESLTGVGPSIAVKILEYRKKNGKFKKIQDIQNVSGIGEEKYNGFKEEICVK